MTPATGFDPAWLSQSALLLVDMNRSHLDHSMFKHRYSPFDNTDLELLLRNLAIKTLVICGVNTNNCVLCSCFDAFNRDYRVVVMRDVCASMNGPDYHDAAIKLIEAALGWVVDSDAVIAALQPASAA